MRTNRVTRISNGYKITYLENIVESKEEALRIYANDLETYNADGLENVKKDIAEGRADIRIAIGDRADEFSKYNTFRIEDINSAIYTYISKFKGMNEDFKYIMYVYSNGDGVYTTTDWYPIDFLDIDDITEIRLEKLKQIKGNTFKNLIELKNAISMALGEIDTYHKNMNIKLKNSDIYLEVDIKLNDEEKRSGYQITYLINENDEIVVDKVYRYKVQYFE